MTIFRTYPKYSDKYALSYCLSAIRMQFDQGYTAISITIMGSQISFTQVLDTMLLDFFFYLITFFSKCQKNQINKILELFKIILIRIYRQSVQLAKIYFSIYLSLLLLSFFET